MGKYQWKEGAKGKIKICAFVEFNSTFNLQDEATLPKMNMKATKIYLKDKARYALLELKKIENNPSDKFRFLLCLNSKIFFIGQSYFQITSINKIPFQIWNIQTNHQNFSMSKQKSG